ncbi:ATP synthase subunit I [Ursidibacter maritimus]|uniref:ATP synthase subunit I n=1 Tax=Ursidibacter maritimus TaxID=1331689 RepID=A0A949T881_9PAST|nr:ATP synthase subunit I [Ursidibacter maritimus]KAE9541448.1 F0F1 ATP synthase subunit I [Ursidibacter maritimus]MBV6524286.1 ATP synthase subunit I [Ursidibacter maritimus]MBV6526553.1 ATP synthase subunit I [Ursidibacter maritimus]MBV6528543.1 ATP synthase subunit I [Ursidibacter maritimus]MBV6530310.1 ATP synthase subunit I [Ursidibacter maritimus]
MSAVLNQAKRLYRIVIILQFLLLVFVSVVLTFLQNVEFAFSYAVGCLCGFIPFCLFVYWIFFREPAKNTNKMTAFYRGEGLKWLLTIILIVVAFKSYPTMNFVAFFVGYFFMLLCNSLLPILLKLRAK